MFVERNDKIRHGKFRPKFQPTRQARNHWIYTKLWINTMNVILPQTYKPLSACMFVPAPVLPKENSNDLENRDSFGLRDKIRFCVYILPRSYL